MKAIEKPQLLFWQTVTVPERSVQIIIWHNKFNQISCLHAIHALDLPNHCAHRAVATSNNAPFAQFSGGPWCTRRKHDRAGVLRSSFLPAHRQRLPQSSHDPIFKHNRAVLRSNLLTPAYARMPQVNLYEENDFPARNTTSASSATPFPPTTCASDTRASE